MGDGEVDLMEVARFLELKADNMTKLKRKTTRHGRLKRRSICQPRRSTVMAPANAGLLRQRSMEPDGTGLSKYKNNRASLVGFRRHSEARLSDFSDFGDDGSENLEKLGEYLDKEQLGVLISKKL